MTAPTFFTVTADYLPSTDKGNIWGTLEFTMLIASGDTLAIPSLDTIIVPVVTPASLSKGVLVDTTGNPGVELLANAAAVGLSGALYYQVTFNQVWYQAPGEAPVEMPLNSFTFQAPTTGTTVDLSTVTPAAGAVAAQIYAATIPGPGLVKSTGTALATAVSGTDYAPATTGSGLLKANGSGGFSAATSGTDYAPPTSGSALLKGNGSGGFAAAASGTDYAPATTGSSLLKANGAGGFSAASSTSDYVPWSAGTGGILPATSGQHLTTQGGNTLDDGSGGVILKGGTLDGVTIGGTTPAVSVAAGTLQSKSPLSFNGAGGTPWLNQLINVNGTLNNNVGAAINSLAFNDSIVGSGNYITGLTVYDNVQSPAVGPRLGIQGEVHVSGVGTSTITQCQYVGILGRADTGVNLGGTPTSAIGEFWGGWFQGTTSGGTHHYSVFGVEVDLSVQSDVQLKVGLRVQTTSTDTTQGTTDDAAIQVFHGSGSVRWLNGLMFGSNQANVYGGSNPSGISQAWPFDSTSTMIGTSVVGSGLPANIGIDFSQVTFTDCAIKTGPAPIQMGAMASAPSTPATGKGKLYVASDGSLHYIGASGTDTRLAVA